jgi:Mg-chelatase subunit ChlD
MYLPPEAFGGMGLGFDEDDVASELASASAWDIATRYHEFKSKKSAQAIVRQLRRLSARAILERAQAVMGSVVHPVEQRVVPWPEVPGDAPNPDFDFDETLENAPLAMAGLAPVVAEDIWMDYTAPRRQAVVLAVDTSLSMTGEKLALTAVALAVVLLQFPDDPVGIVAFENESKVVKRPDERISLQEMLERFLDVPAQGYTHLEDGLKGALDLVRYVTATGQARPPSTVLLTDGKYTAGRDPAFLAPRFPHLVVLKMGKERASLELCREMAQKGHGALREVGELEALPTVMYGVVKDLLRGRSLA